MILTKEAPFARHDKERPITIINVELNLEELEQIVEALNQKHDALSSGGTEVVSGPQRDEPL
jgi:hypothetical protein